MLRLACPVTLICLLASPAVSLAAGKLALQGVQRLSEQRVRAVAGALPADRSKLSDWAERATERIVKLYKKKGYEHARGWHQVRGEDVHIAIDEGRMTIAFVGTNPFQSMRFRMRFDLLDKVFYRPTVERALEQLKREYQLVNIYYRVSEQTPLTSNAFGQLVPQLVMRIYAISAERFGWSFSISFDSVFGPVPAAAAYFRDVMLDDDRISGKLGIGIPFREFVFQEDPKFQWVHGQIELAYRLPPFAKGFLAPEISGEFALSRYSRTGQLIENYLESYGEALGKLVVLPASLISLSVGLGVTYTHAFDIDPPAAGDSDGVVRFVTRLEPAIAFNKGVTRWDRRSEVKARIDLGFTSKGSATIDTEVKAQWVVDFGSTVLIVRGRGLLIAGNVFFWDEQNLGGSYLRTFFANRYWVREALQATVDYRWAILSFMQIGAFADLSLFGDRVDENTGLKDDPVAAVANSFGPSMDFLLFDIFSLELYYGFGFAPAGFDHTFSFKLQTVF